MVRKIDVARRAAIGAEKRNRTRAQLINAAKELYGDYAGRGTRIEDICARASMARGTFYNHFSGIEDIQVALLETLSRDFDDAVHVVFEQFDCAASRAAAAIRYYLGRATVDQAWGWGMVHTGMGNGLPENQVTDRVEETIQEGIDKQEFTILSPRIGRDMVLGAGLAAMITILQEKHDQAYADRVSQHILMGLGIPHERAAKLIQTPLPPLNWHSAKPSSVAG